MKKKIYTMAAIMIIVVLMSSCISNLSRDESKDLIIEHYKLPQPVKVFLTKRYTLPSPPLLDVLSNKGLVTIAPFTFDNNESGVKISLTEMGKKYSDFEDGYDFSIKLCDIAFDKIIDMRQDAAQAEVNYKLKYENYTPFGEGYEKCDEMQDISNETKTEMFLKYDDGWKWR